MVPGAPGRNRTRTHRRLELPALPLSYKCLASRGRVYRPSPTSWAGVLLRRPRHGRDEPGEPSRPRGCCRNRTCNPSRSTRPTCTGPATQAYHLPLVRQAAPLVDATGNRTLSDKHSSRLGGNPTGNPAHRQPSDSASHPLHLPRSPLPGIPLPIAASGRVGAHAHELTAASNDPPHRPTATP